MSLTALRIDDSVTTCDCCGRTDLKATVLMLEGDTGSLLHFGRVCASRNSGKPSQQLTKEMRAERDLATGRAGNRLQAMRRAGTKLTRDLVREVSAQEGLTDAKDLAVMVRNWVR